MQLSRKAVGQLMACCVTSCSILYGNLAIHKTILRRDERRCTQDLLPFHLQDRAIALCRRPLVPKGMVGAGQLPPLCDLRRKGGAGIAGRHCGPSPHLINSVRYSEQEKHHEGVQYPHVNTMRPSSACFVSSRSKGVASASNSQRLQSAEYSGNVYLGDYDWTECVSMPAS